MQMILCVQCFSVLPRLVVEDVADEGGQIRTGGRTPDELAVCPGCRGEKTRVHGHHERSWADVPVDARPMLVVIARWQAGLGWWSGRGFGFPGPDAVFVEAIGAAAISKRLASEQVSCPMPFHQQQMDSTENTAVLWSGRRCPGRYRRPGRKCRTAWPCPSPHALRIALIACHGPGQADRCPVHALAAERANRTP
jgi:hypothetical protein